MALFCHSFFTAFCCLQPFKKGNLAKSGHLAMRVNNFKAGVTFVFLILLLTRALRTELKRLNVKCNMQTNMQIGNKQ